MSDSQTVKCRFCGNPYKTYSMLCADQSCCPSCRNEAGSTFNSQAKKCPICGKLYAVHMHTVLDQSACPSCVFKAEVGERFNPEIEKTFNKYFKNEIPKRWSQNNKIKKSCFNINKSKEDV